MERIRKCKEVRENSVAAGIRKFADTPTLFAQRTQPVDKDFIIVPRVSSQARRYVPMGFIKAGTIVTDRVQVIPDASLYDFGIIISNIHFDHLMWHSYYNPVHQQESGTSFLGYLPAE